MSPRAAQAHRVAAHRDPGRRSGPGATTAVPGTGPLHTPVVTSDTRFRALPWEGVAPPPPNLAVVSDRRCLRRREDQTQHRLTKGSSCFDAQCYTGESVGSGKGREPCPPAVRSRPSVSSVAPGQCTKRPPASGKDVCLPCMGSQLRGRDEGCPLGGGQDAPGAEPGQRGRDRRKVRQAHRQTAEGPRWARSPYAQHPLRCRLVLNN